MTPLAKRRLRWLKWAAILVTLAFAVHFARTFAWDATLESLAEADWTLVLVAVVVNLASLSAKGWAWHLLLLPYAPNRWRTAQVATFAGAAVNCIAVSVGGEAVRVGHLVSRDRVPVGAVVSSVVLSRVVEALALVACLAVAAFFFPAEGWLGPVRLVIWALALVLLGLTWAGAWPRLVAVLPGWARRILGPLAEPGAGRALAAPLALDTVNWLCEWVTCHLVILALGIQVSPLVSLTALVAQNVGGIFRVTPGNVGVVQGSMILAMAPFGVAAEASLAAGLVLQAVQTVPVIALGLLLAGGSTLKGAVADR